MLANRVIYIRPQHALPNCGECQAYFKRLLIGDNEISDEYEKSGDELSIEVSKREKWGISIEIRWAVIPKWRVWVKEVEVRIPKMAIEGSWWRAAKSEGGSFAKTKPLVLTWLRFLWKKLNQMRKFSLLLFVATLVIHSLLHKSYLELQFEARRPKKSEITQVSI